MSDLPPTARRKPDWLRVRLGSGPNYERVGRIMREGKLHTVCEEAMCPNRGRCWEHGRATIMILGEICSRSCTFCNVCTRTPQPLDDAEPQRVADAVKAMGLTDVVVTSVTRDDLPDGGAAAWANTIRRIRATVPAASIEVLIPDFKGDTVALDAVIDARPDVLGHNLETVPSLYAAARPQADFARSLGVLRHAHERGMLAKTGVMLGLGETRGELLELMREARETGCEILSLGQYLQPTPKHLPVARFVEPAEFDELKAIGLAMGFGVVVSAPLVRSSFHSDEQAAYVSLRRPAAEP